MKKEILKNKIRFLYKYREGKHTSFSIALEAGANSEGKGEIGFAHALEHMIYKGTPSLSEEEINKKLDELFGTNNAMTNFPYVIYYGTLSNEDFYEGFSLHGEMLSNSNILDSGFKEELNVIKQESKEWSEDLEQYVEDLMFYNGFRNERIGEIIIGKEKNIEKITIEDLRDFYKRLYRGENIVVSVVTSLDYDYVKNIVEEKLSRIKPEIDRNIEGKRLNKHRLVNSNTFKDFAIGNNGCKIAYGFDISFLNLREITALKLFNLWFGEGVSSILYDSIRTKMGLAYEVYSSVKWEKGIGVFKIALNTDKNFYEKALSIVDKCIEKGNNLDELLSEEDLNKLIKRFKLKISLELEKSIVLANRMAIYEILYNDGNEVFNEVNMVYNYTVKEIKEIVNKVLRNPIIEVLL
ncbi:MAG: pitrilysin family protein [Clostridium perfringens]|nr:pitrilysin family protein [Clostridium perfringens]